MKLILSLIISFLMLTACKTKSSIITNTKKITPSKEKSTIEKYYSNSLDFSTLYVKANAKYTDDKQNQTLGAEIKIKKDEKIVISLRFLGITMAKALITPTSVNYYEKMNGSYFEGNFEILSKWLGTDLNFEKIQNLILGRAIDDLKKGKYIETKNEQAYKLEEITPDLKKIFYLNSETFFVEKQEITQIQKDRMIQIECTEPQYYNQILLPKNILIKGFQKKQKTEINLNYSSISMNEELSFTYNVPKGYKKIIIK